MIDIFQPFGVGQYYRSIGFAGRRRDDGFAACLTGVLALAVRLPARFAAGRAFAAGLLDLRVDVFRDRRAIGVTPRRRRWPALPANACLANLGLANLGPLPPVAMHQALSAWWTGQALADYRGRDRDRMRRKRAATRPAAVTIRTLGRLECSK